MTDNTQKMYIPPYLNHPRTLPVFATDYQPEVLTKTQQSMTDAAKISMVRENERYLGQHPEVKAIVSLILRSLFVHRPHNIYEFVGKFVSRKKFAGEIIEFLIEEKQNIPESQDEVIEEDNDDIAPQYVESDVTIGDQNTMMSRIAHLDHRILKDVLYGADHKVPRNIVKNSATAQQNYDMLVKFFEASQSGVLPIPSATGTHQGSLVGVAGRPPSHEFSVHNVNMDEDEDDDESDDSDNEGALLIGQRLIFAMLGKRMPSWGAVNTSNLTNENPPEIAMHAAFCAAEDEEVPSPSSSDNRFAVFEDMDAPVDEENEEYFD